MTFKSVTDNVLDSMIGEYAEQYALLDLAINHTLHCGNPFSPLSAWERGPGGEAVPGQRGEACKPGGGVPSLPTMLVARDRTGEVLNLLLRLKHRNRIP